MPTNDPAKQRKYRRDYYKRNREQILSDIKEKRAEENRRLGKVPLTDEQREQNRKDSQRKYKKRQREEATAYIEKYKENNPCKLCGESHIGCLVFHHQDPSEKEDNVSSLIKKGLKRVAAEIEKCEVLCSNCHMKLHWDERQKG